MSGSDGVLKHLAFFEELAQLEETDPSWNSVSAGLVVLRLVDAWIVEGARAVASDAWGVRAVRAAITDVSERTPLRTILASIVDTIESAGATDMRLVAPRLLAYGQALEYEAKWTLAADVFETILAHVHPIEDADIVTMAHLRLALCFLDLGQLDDSATSYRRAGQVAQAVGDMVGVLRARIGEARVAVKRGNLPSAERILDDTIASANGPELREVRARALHERSTVAAHRGQFELTIRLAYEALDCPIEAREKDRILNNIAVAFMELGVLSSARDAFLVLAATAQEQFMRWAATLNLMDLAGQELAQTTFERYRRELAGAALTPHMAASFELLCGQGYQRFGDFERARAAMNRARVVAEQHGFAQVLFSAEHGLAAIEQRQRLAGRVSVEVAEELTDIAESIRVMGRRYVTAS